MYIPKPGELIYSTGGSFLNENYAFKEVIIFLGESGKKRYGCNFFHKNIIYDFPTKMYNLDILKLFNRFNINRVPKKLKPKFKINQLIEIPQEALWFPYGITPITDEKAKIISYKLIYNDFKKKCLIAYGIKVPNELNLFAQKITIRRNYVYEQEVKPIINYNFIWQNT